MNEKEFHDGMTILQGAAGKNYRETSFPVWWEALKNEYGGAYLSVCRELAQTEPRLPALSEICRRLSEIKHAHTADKNKQREGSYLAEQEARAREAEKIVGNTFENFLRANNGDHPLAGYYFGRAYWNARGITRYDAAYDRLAEGRERFLQNPAQAKKEAEAAKKKDLGEKMEIGRAMDSAAGYAQPPAPAEGKPPDIPYAASTPPPEEKEVEFDETTLPF